MNTSNEQTLENKIGIVFKNKNLLHLILVHRSFLNEKRDEKESNERLEFLGDAVLELVISEHLYTAFPTQNEGHLTALRSKLVNTISLAESAREIGLGEVLYLSRGEEQGGGRDNTSLLANTMEALIGAIFLDQGIEKAGEFIRMYIVKKIPETVKKSLKDAKSLFQEYVQASGLPAPVYRVVKEEGPDHAKEFEVEVRINNASYSKGKGASKKVATQVAAEIALEMWKKNSFSQK